MSKKKFNIGLFNNQFQDYYNEKKQQILDEENTNIKKLEAKEKKNIKMSQIEIIIDNTVNIIFL